ncbi:MAG: hypothetical protein AAGC46_03030 [Solirubrobacteraceae bacterium]|nr:hypothetical protein [Patulibacter sp.]
MRRILLILAATFAAILGAAAPAYADNAIEGTRINQQVATFTPPSVPTKVTIDWGDGTAKDTTGVGLQPDKSGVVIGSHVYAKFGFYTVKTTDANNPDNSATTSIIVDDAPVTAQGIDFTAAAAGGGVTVASVTDGNPLGNPADFKATIDWGDGTTTDGTVSSAGAPGKYTVTGAHAYGDTDTHIAGVTIRSADLGTANTSVQATGVGATDPPQGATKGADGTLTFPGGHTPSMVVEDDGTADLVWAVDAPGRTGDSIVYCKLPRGATVCATKRTFVVDALTAPKILRDRFGGLHIVVSYNGVLQLGGGTLIINSGDAGQNWSLTFFPVNTGLFQGGIIDATMSNDGRTLYALFGDFVPGDELNQTYASFTLDRAGVFGREDNPGFVNGSATYSARTLATLPDGRVVMAGYDTSAKIGAIPRAAIRVMTDANGNGVSQPWVPIRGGVVSKLASSAQGASLMGEQDCDKGVDILPLRGTTVGAARQIAGDRSVACNGAYESMSYDSAGGRHAVWLSDEDGCAGKKWDDAGGICILTRYARPGADWGPKTTVAKLPTALARGLSVATGSDGQGWVTWESNGDNGASVMVAPTQVESEAQVDADHRIALSFKPSSECSKSGSYTIGVQVVGPNKGKPTVKSVKWSAGYGLTPKTSSDDKAPFSATIATDKKKARNISSTGTVVLSSVLHATVKYSVPGKKGTQTAKLQQTLSYYCGISWDKVRKSLKK